MCRWTVTRIYYCYSILLLYKPHFILELITLQSFQGHGLRSFSNFRGNTAHRLLTWSHKTPKSWSVSSEFGMDNSKKNGSAGPKWFWTNERHVRFLNSIEASFVQAMFENNPRSFRLDRQLPDCSESTQDLGKYRRRRHSTSGITMLF